MSRVLICLVCLVAVSAAAVAEPVSNGAWIGAVDGLIVPVVLPSDNLWYYCAAQVDQIGPDGQGGWMYIPSQADLWQVTGPGCLSITDAWISGDQFEVYMDNNLILTTPLVADNMPPEINPDVPGTPVPFVEQGLVLDAYHAENYSSGFVPIPDGDHIINVKVIHFPEGYNGAGFGIRYSDTCSPVEPASWSGIKAMFR